MKKFALLCATSALVMPASAWAQTTGSIEIEEEIVVTGTRAENGVEGIVVPDVPRAQQVLTQDLIQRQASGQTILNTINLVPGVNFTNSDPYGSSGGSIRIRGFEGNRISLTFDGLPINDTGNYAIYSNQQLDPELIEQVSVNLGTTEVDSPTASAAGGTVNYRTRLPGRTLGGRVAASYGTDEFHRVFGMIDTGDLTSFGTRAFVAASYARNDQFRGPGEIYKQQYNARLYQPLGSNGDFVSISGHYNQNRNHFYFNPSVRDLRSLLGTFSVPADSTATPQDPIVIDFTRSEERRIFNELNRDAACEPDAGRTFAGCGDFYELFINPSNTGNIRGNSRFTLAEGLVLTVDPSFQYVLANGGGTGFLRENDPVLIGGAGVDLNGDGDVTDSVRMYRPNNTNTRRYGLTSSLIWTLSPEHRFRLAYTFDYGRHRQTGDFGFLDAAGRPENVFGGRNGTPVLDSAGNQVQLRNRLSIAQLHQIAGQYVGRFMDDRLRVELGLRLPFFKRELEQYCFTQTGGSGFATCPVEGAGPGGPIVDPNAPGLLPNGSFFAPFEAQYEFSDPLPNVGATYRLTDDVSVFASYARGFSAPRTDNLYRAPTVDIEPEKTNAFDTGIRFTNRRVQAQAVAWYLDYSNRIISSFDPDLGISLDRNVGKVRSYGLDASIAFRPIDPVMLYLFGSYINATFREDVEVGRASGNPVFAPTRGRMVPETPKWQFGGRAQFELGPVEFGVQAKYVDDRFATDTNDVRVKDYTLFDLDARLSLAPYGLERTYLQLNVQNLFDTFYFGNISTQIRASNNPNFSVGAPRSVMATLNIGF